MIHVPWFEPQKESKILRISNFPQRAYLDLGQEREVVSLRALTTMAVKTSYPLTKEVWFSFKMIVVAKFKVNNKKKRKKKKPHR